MMRYIPIVVVASFFLCDAMYLVPASAQTAVNCAAQYDARKTELAASGITAGVFVDGCMRGQTLTSTPTAVPLPPEPQLLNDAPLGVIRTYRKQG
jgi:hypothetical protein